MIRWTGNTDRPTTSSHRRPDRRDLVAFTVAFVAALVVIGSLWLIGAQDANGSTRPSPRPQLTGTPVQTAVRCTPILVHSKGTLYGCTNGRTHWSPKRATR